MPALALGWLFGCSGDDSDTATEATWLVTEQDLGAALAEGSGFAFETSNDAWFAAEQVVPTLEWDYPASSIPLYLWDLAYSDNVADPGSCPTEIIEDGDLVYKTYGCRSTDGYEWTGEARQSKGTLGDWETLTWTFDIEVTGDVERPVFDRLVLRGDVVYISGGDGELVRAAQSNVRAGIDGYWEARNVTDGREEAWADWVLTARFEHREGDRHVFSGAADLGGLGGFSFESRGLTEATTCAGEPEGRLIIDADQKATLSFEGAEGCDRCASLDLDGEFAGQACG